MIASFGYADSAGHFGDLVCWRKRLNRVINVIIAVYLFTDRSFKFRDHSATWLNQYLTRTADVERGNGA
jgi:hypothetical protein